MFVNLTFLVDVFLEDDYRLVGKIREGMDYFKFDLCVGNIFFGRLGREVGLGVIL